MDKLVRFLKKFFSPSLEEQKQDLQQAIYNITTLTPHNLSLYQLALSHSSLKEISSYSNERLEFLGDAVLSLVVAEYLFKKFPLQEEGFLTEIRSRIVNRTSLGELAKKIGIDELLSYDKRSVNQKNLKFAYGNALEAFIGAVYLDRGYQNCSKFIIENLLNIHLDIKNLVQTDTNYKSKILAWAQKNKKKVTFDLIRENKSHGTREFVVQIGIDLNVYGEGIGKTKKQAEQMASEVALKRINHPEITAHEH